MNELIIARPNHLPHGQSFAKLTAVKMTRRVYSLALAGLLVLAGVRSASAAETFVESGIERVGRQPVIITFAPGQEAKILDVLKTHGHTVSSKHPSIGGLSVEIDGSDVADLLAHGALGITRSHKLEFESARSVRGNAKIQPKLDPTAAQGQNVSTLRLSLGLEAGAEKNRNSDVVNGSGVKIAIIDSGLAAELAGSDEFPQVKCRDYTKPEMSSVCRDDFGHGTHVAGLIASTGALSGYMFQGVAPNATLLVMKVLDASGAAMESTVIQAIEDAVMDGARVINLSLGHRITQPARWDPLVQAIEAASRKGVIVVVAAGNRGPASATISSPGNAPSAITVGAADGKTTVTRADDYVIGFSSRGPTWYDGFAKPDVVAPGVNLFSNAAAGSTLVMEKSKKKPGTSTYPQEVVGSAALIDLSGTSMAAAVTTGVVALELDANAHQLKAPLTPNAAKAILEYTAIKLPNADVLTQGAGQINAAGAIELAGKIDTTVAVGKSWLPGGVTPASQIGGTTYEWAQNIIWGTSVLGGRFIYFNGLMWDDNIIWGTGVVRGRSLVAGRSFDNIIWGTNVNVIQKSVVWNLDDGDNIIWGTHLAQFRVIGQRVGNKIVWARDDVDNIIWGTLDADNIVWGTDDGDNIIWGTWSSDGDNIIWGTTDDDNIIWGTSLAQDNIIWGTSAPKSAIVGSNGVQKIVWAKNDVDNIIWGTADSDNIIWGTADDNIIWGTDEGDNIIWGTDDGDNIIWGTSVGGGN